MKSILRLFVLLLWTLIAVSAKSDDSSNAVTVLTGATFDKFVKENPITLVKFMAPWCGHCKRLAPEYEEAAEELKKLDSIPLADVDASEETELAKKYNINGFPTLLLFRNGQPEPYSGGRTKKTIVEWVEKMTGPAMEWIEKSDAEKLIAEIKADSKYPVAFFGAFPDKKAATLFESLADTNRTKGKFFAYVDPSVTEAIVTVQRVAEESSTHKLDNKDAAAAWILAESFPLFGPVSAENYSTYFARSENWVWLGGDVEAEAKFAPLMRRVSRNYRTDFNFVWLDTAVLKSHAENALGMTSFPSVVVVWDGAKFHYPGSSEITEKGLTKFVESVKAGKAPKFLKSEVVPEQNDEPVMVVVGKQFSELVLQKDKDVFLTVYAPWCGHCKKIAPIWDELADKVKGNKHLVIAKMDGTSNEPDVEGFDIHGFPSLFFVKAGSKTPVAFDGARTLEGFMSFLKSHSSQPVIESDKDEL